MIDVQILDVKPHPDQATTHPDCWAVQIRVVRAGKSRMFWRWWYARSPRGAKPTVAEIIPWFWDDTFGNLHGFDFEQVVAL